MGEDNKKDSAISDVIKKVVSIGIGAAFMTEESVKGVLADLPLPKDIINGLTQNAKTAKEEFANSIREELSKQMSKVDPTRLIEDLVEKYDIEVEAKFKFKKKTPPTE